MTLEAFTITCRQCNQIFDTCKSCYRGQVYCSLNCRHLGYDARRRIARKKHAQSPEGKLDHSDRNKKYRLKKNSEKIVMDNTFTKIKTAIKTDPQSRTLCSIDLLERRCVHCKAVLPEGSVFYERSIQVPIGFGPGPPD